MRVVVTREDLVERVAALGHDAVLCELIRIEPLGDEPIDARGYDWLVVTSRNGAHELGRRGVTANRIAAIGPATAEALRAHGLPVDLVARTHPATVTFTASLPSFAAAFVLTLALRLAGRAAARRHRTSLA